MPAGGAGGAARRGGARAAARPGFRRCQEGRLRAASAPAATCFALLRHTSSVLCWDLEHPGVRELDGRTLVTRRTVAADVRPTLNGPVVGADGVLVVPAGKEDASDPVDHFLTAYDWRHRPAPVALRRAPGDRRPRPRGQTGAVLRRVRPRRAEHLGRRQHAPQEGHPATGSGTGAAAVHLGQPLYPGGALFADTDEGKVVSGYAP
ncbi:hypothetical protein ACWFRM_16000 [Streptomyces sp. NPDC055144]